MTPRPTHILPKNYAYKLEGIAAIHAVLMTIACRQTATGTLLCIVARDIDIHIDRQFYLYLSWSLLLRTVVSRLLMAEL